ncbi:MAG: DNA-3-methyladenine glycosylase [Myxococcota bacterium]|nr:DNA-3-methyladenine glycosylase [Myxococcota bacterium]
MRLYPESAMDFKHANDTDRGASRPRENVLYVGLPGQPSPSRLPGCSLPPMKWGRIHPRNFYARPVLDVARELLGSLLIRQAPDGLVLAGRLVEVEAYLGDGSDPSAHSHRGPTRRNKSMFGPPGHLYAYSIYGIHTCINLVCEPRGVGSAILIRAIEPLMGIDRMRANRGLESAARGPLIASGPGRLSQAFGFSLDDDGRPLNRSDLCIRAPGAWDRPLCMVQGPRIGISKAVQLPYRFYAEDDAWVSRVRKSKRVSEKTLEA